MAGSTRVEVSRSFLRASRMLLSFFLLLLLVTPWTEGYRLLDNFPRGQDSELNILALLAFLGLVLLITRSARRMLRNFLMRNWFWRLLLHPALLLRLSAHGQTSVPIAAPPLLVPCSGAFNLPLLI